MRAYMQDRIDHYPTLSFVGLERACGKTTVLKAFLETCRDRIYGVTSIGTDHLSLQIPAGDRGLVYVHKGTLIATARQALAYCDTTKEILLTTGIPSPLGEIILFKALSDGFVFLAGPSRITDVLWVKKAMIDAGAGHIFIDGAVDRKSAAMPALADGVILASKLFSADYDNPDHKIIHQLNLLNVPGLENQDLLALCIKFSRECETFFLVDENNQVYFPEKGASIDQLVPLIHQITANLQAIYLPGAVTNPALRKLLTGDRANRKKMSGAMLIAEDATKLFLDSQQLQKLNRLSISLRVLYSLNLLGLGVNPAESGLSADEIQHWMQQCAAYFKFPVFDAAGGVLVEGF